MSESQVYENGGGSNGRVPVLPLSRKRFQRDLPTRIGGLELKTFTQGRRVDAIERRLDDLSRRLEPIEQRNNDHALVAQAVTAQAVAETFRLAMGKPRPRRRVLPIE